MAAALHEPVVLVGRFRELEDALCRRLRALQAEDALAPVTVVVGSSPHRSQLADLLVRRLGAVANVSLVTLARHAAALAAWAGAAPRLGAAGRERLLRLLVEDARLGYFGPVARRPHFPAALAGTFADLRQALVDAEGGWQAHLSGPGTGSDAGRADDLSLLYAAYCDALEQRGVTDDAGTYVAAAGAAPALAVTSGRPVPAAADGGQITLWPLRYGGHRHTILFGLYDINAVQGRFVRALLDLGADLFVPLPAGTPTQATVLGLRHPGAEPATRLTWPVAATDRERLACLWQDPAPQAPEQDRARLRLEGDGTLAVLSVPDERSEAREAARAVLQAASAGIAAWNCAVVVPSAADRERVAAALDAAGLPYACRTRSGSSGRRALLALLDCVAPPAGPAFARRPVIDLLCAAPLRQGRSTDRDRSLWLDEARRAGVLAGQRQWADRAHRHAEELARRAVRMRAEAALAGLPDDEDPATVSALEARLSAAQTLTQAVGALEAACGELPDTASWTGWSSALGAAIGRLFAEPVAAEAMDAAACLVPLDAIGETVDLAVAASVLRTELDASQTMHGRVGRDGVAVLTPLELRGLSFSTVVFSGLAEGGFPSVGRSDPLLNDADRRRLADALGTRLPLSEERAAESLLLFAFACEAARDRLVLIVPRADAATGRPRLPSRLLLQLASLAAGRPVGLDEFLDGEPLRPVWRHVSGPPACGSDQTTVWFNAQERDSALLLALGESGDHATRTAFLAQVLGGAATAQRRLAALKAAGSPEPGPWDGVLGDDARARLAVVHPLHGEIAPTRLERYVTCPFQFFLRDVLGLAAPEEPADGVEIEATEYGSLAHLILQRAYEKLIAAWPELAPDARVEAACAALREAWAFSCAEAERAGVTGARLAWEVRRQVLLEDLLQTVRRDPVLAGGEAGRPLSAEWRFGDSAGRPVAVRLADGRRVRFAGRVDRVDQTPRGVLVIDYKTGSGVTEERRLGAGLCVQLPVYRVAAAVWLDECGGEAQAAYRLVTRRGGFRDIVLDESGEETTRQLCHLVAAAGELIDRGLFPRSSKGSCEYCDIRYACGATAWTRARKREHRLLADVVRLQNAGSSAGGADG